MIAQEYASAIYDIAVEEKKVDLFNTYFVQLLDTLSGDFLKLLEAPNIDKKEKMDVIDKVYKSIDPTFVNFIKVLLDNKRLSYFSKIGHQYRKFVRKDKNIVIVGGTGLYLKAGLYNYEFTEEDEFNPYDELSNEELLDRVKEIDPDTDIHVNNIKDTLKGKYPDKELEVKNIVNPNLIGGIQIVCNGESIDMSLKSSINRLKEIL